MPLPAALRLKVRSDRRQVARPGRLDLVQEIEQPPEALAAAEGRQALRQPVVERLDHDAVQVDQADEAERGGDLLGVVQLGRRAEIHRQAVVDQQVEVQVFLFQEQADEELVEAGEQVPVEEAQVVADDVVVVVGELDALALALRAPFALHPAEEDLARDQLELFEPGQEFGSSSGVTVSGMILIVSRCRMLRSTRAIA